MRGQYNEPHNLAELPVRDTTPDLLDGVCGQPGPATARLPKVVHIALKENTGAHPRGNVELYNHGQLGGHSRDHGDTFAVHAWLSIVCSPTLAPLG